MTLDIDKIDPFELKVETGYYLISEYIKNRLDENETISDEVFSWIINPPAIYNSIESDEIKKAKKRDALRFNESKEHSIKIVQLLKKEFYNFMCTESKYYQKERISLGGNINLVITGVSSAIATKIGSLEIGIVTSLVAAFFIVVAKMGKNAVCEYFKPQ